MSYVDAASIWAQLRNEGRLQGEPPPDVGDSTPWYVRLLAGIGAWIASLLLLGFFGMLLSDLLDEGVSALVVGLLLCAGAGALLRRAEGEFLRQGATAACQAGLALIGLGLAAGLDLSDDAVAAALLVAAAALYATAPVFVHRFLCGGVMLGAMLWLLADDLSRLSTLQLVPAWLAAALWLWRGFGDPGQARAELVTPIAWAATLIALAIAWWAPYDVAPGTIVASRLLSAALLPAVALVLAWPHRHGSDRTRLALLLAASLVMAWLWWFSPGVTFAIALLLIAWSLGSPPLLAVAVAGLAVYLVAYYYQLAVPLLVKAQWLAIAGAAALILHLANRRWRRGEAS